MSCKFSVPFSEPVESAVQKAKTAVESQSGVFNGDVNSGQFEVTVFGNFVKGNYTVTDQILNIEITDKPFFVPCNMIETFLVKNIS
ncbi:MAG: hypothetical protein ABIN48_07010 [Ginsengibacter sp.]